MKICSNNKKEQPLVHIDISNNAVNIKNTAPEEVQAIVDYAVHNKEKTIGVITPFVNQKKMVEETLARENIKNVVCGTVHAF